MYTMHHPDLHTLLEVTRPGSLLLIDPSLDDLTAMPSHTQITRLCSDRVEQLRSLGRFDLGVVANTLEHLDRATAVRILAMLRDLHTRRFVALAPLGGAWENHRSHWQTVDLLGYGMTLMARYQVEGKPVHLYHYAIESYKTSPEWFNSKHWAHPERWKA